MRLRSIGVVGAGTMGQGIVQTAAVNGIDVVFKEISREHLETAWRAIETALDREIDRWAITSSEKKAHLSRITGTESYDDLRHTDVIIEAVEDLWDRKSEVIHDLDLIIPDERVIVTTSSTLSVSELARETRRPDKIIGMHFLRPVPKRALVEVVRGFHTSDDTYAVARRFAEALGKTAVEIHEYPGFVTTRVILPLLAEAMQTVMEGVATVEDVDRAMKLGFDFPAGPFQIADQMGLDDVLNSMEHLFQELGDPKFRPPAILRRLVRAGHLGVKTRQGFFSYNEFGEKTGGAIGGDVK